MVIGHHYSANVVAIDGLTDGTHRLDWLHAQDNAPDLIQLAA